MKSTPKKQFDKLGRICIPKFMRNNLGIIPGVTPVEIYENENEIVIRRIEDSCVFCGRGHELTEFNNKKICSECLHKLKGL